MEPGMEESQSAVAVAIELKRGPGGPLLCTGEVGGYRFLPAFFFPPLAFFAIVCYPPFHVGCASAPAHRSWLPPGTLMRCRRSSLTRDGTEFTILIPDVDSKRQRSSVKHKPTEKVKTFARDLRLLHARSQLLLVGVTLDRERNQAIEKLWIGESARGPHLRVH